MNGYDACGYALNVVVASVGAWTAGQWTGLPGWVGVAALFGAVVLLARASRRRDALDEERARAEARATAAPLWRAPVPDAPPSDGDRRG